MTAENMHKNVEIREYRDSDFNACRSLWAELVLYHRDIYDSLDMGGSDPGLGFEQYLEDPLRVKTWVALFDGKIVGLAGLLLNTDEHSEVEPIIVSEKYRGRRIGSALMKRVIAAAEQTGARFLSIRPGARNEKSFSRFVRLGFDRVWTIELTRDLKPELGMKWLPGLKIHDNELEY